MTNKTIFRTTEDLYNYYFNKFQKTYTDEQLAAADKMNLLNEMTNKSYKFYFTRYNMPMLLDYDYIEDYLKDYLDTALDDDDIRDIFEIGPKYQECRALVKSYEIEDYIKNDLLRPLNAIKEIIDINACTARWKGEGFGDYRCDLCDGVVSGRPHFCPECFAKMSNPEEQEGEKQ